MKFAGKRSALAGFVVVALAIFASGEIVIAAPEVQVIRTPDSGIEPQVQIDDRGRLHFIYFKGDPKHGNVFYARSDDEGASFTAALRVNSDDDSAIAIGTVRGPHLAIGSMHTVHVAWMGAAAESQPAPMLYARMDEAAKKFEPQRNLSQLHPGLDGGGAIAADQSGNVYAVWHAPEHPRGDETDRRVWVAHSSDGGKTFATETPATPAGLGCCGCCGMNVASDSKGNLYIAFRTATALVERDMQLLVSNDHGRTYHVAASDPWHVNMCVMSTAAFASDRDSVIAAWETQNQIRVARLGAASVTPLVISTIAGTGQRKHPAVAVNQRGEFIVAWAEGTGWGKGGAVAWAVMDREGHPISTGHADGLPIWDKPAVYATKNGDFRVIF